MAARQDEARIVRTLRMLRAIAARRHGVRVSDLMDELEVSRSSIYRYLEDLEKGAGLTREQRAGEAWVRLPADWGTRPGVAELFALVVARQVLSGLAGTKAQRWLEPRLRGADGARLSVESSVPVEPDVAAAVEAALSGQRRRLAFQYRGFQSDGSTRRTVEPLELRFSQRAWYLFAFDVEKGELRTFKLARMKDAELLNAACTQVVAVDPQDAHAHAVSVWSTSEVHDVAVRIHPPHAAVAHEYPLQASQRIEADGDTVVVHARVAGLEEVTRWVLRWGGDATVLEPAALRARVRSEYERALERMR